MNAVLLIADTDETLLEIYRDYFTDCGYDVKTASGGVECLTWLRNASPIMLLLDMELLWGGGDGVLAHLQNDPASARPLQVFVTGDECPEHLSLRTGVPVARCFQKPFRVSELLNQMRNAKSCCARCAGVPVSTN